MLKSFVHKSQLIIPIKENRDHQNSHDQMPLNEILMKKIQAKKLREI